MAVAGAMGAHDAEWAYSHANEIQQTHEAAARTTGYLLNGGVTDLTGKALDTVGMAVSGDVSAIGDVSEFAAGFVGGGGTAKNMGIGSSRIAAVGATVTERLGEVTATTAKAAGRVVSEAADAVVENIAKVSGEVASGAREFTQGVLEGKGGRLNPLNYQVQGLGSNLGNVHYRPKADKIKLIDSASGSAGEVATKSGKTYVTYTLKNADGEVVYVGRASGTGSAEEVLRARLAKGHHIYDNVPNLKAEVKAFQGNRSANLGAEDVWYNYYKEDGAYLLNDPSTPPLSSKPSKLPQTRERIDAYSKDLLE
jgi:hypothetical protein